MNANIFNTQNYLVPATGYTRGFKVAGTFSSTPFTQDFNSIELDGIPFRPSGVFIDNTNGVGTLTVVINSTGFSMAARAGEFLAIPYPAPINQSVDITGDGDAVLIFVDFPVIPYRGGIYAGEPVMVTNIDSLVESVVGFDTAGGALPSDFSTAAIVFAYNASGDLDTETVTTADASVYVRTYSYTSGNLTGVSGWVKQ